MQGETNETVGPNFSEQLLHTARNKTLEVINLTAKRVHVGMRESEARKLLQEIQTETGAPKSWHPPQIRFGQNTLLSFGQKPTEDYVLNENDIFFFDIGPLFEDHEGDVGRAFSVSNDADMKRCCVDVETIWNQVRDHWKKEQVSGPDLYQYAKKAAADLGWILSLEKANGHRISDFPHIARLRGCIDGFEQTPTPDRWILEIQIRHPEKPFGAFYEDLLN